MAQADVEEMRWGVCACIIHEITLEAKYAGAKAIQARACIEVLFLVCGPKL